MADIAARSNEPVGFARPENASEQRNTRRKPGGFLTVMPSAILLPGAEAVPRIRSVTMAT